jgi:hypothetical protein
VAPVASHALLGLSVAALGAAALRIGSLAAPHGLERLLAAAAFGAAAAALHALGLGLAGLGTSPVALPLAAVGTWLAARRLLPEPAYPPGRELASWWAGLSAGGRAAAGAAAGAVAVWAAWLMRHPVLDSDSLTYHLPQVVSWVRDGRPGSVETVLYEFPVGSYPLTNEVMLAWGCGIARSFIPVALWQPAMLALLATAAWAGTRALGVPRLPAALAAAGIASAPQAVFQLSGAKNDLAMLAWLACTGALAAGSARRPALLAPALVAAALAAGTKATALVPAALVLAPAFVARRDALRPVGRALAVAGVVAALVGGLWYARNLVLHGSPLWPFAATPWGDPVPPFLERMSDSLLDRPGLTLEGRAGRYVGLLGGGTLAIAAALVLVPVARSRAVLATGSAAAGLVLLWAASPFSGVPDPPAQDVSLTTVRYVLPAVAAATLALALAARSGRFTATLATAALAGTLAWNVERDLQLGFGRVPPAWLLACGLAAGAALLALRAERAWRWAPQPGLVAVVAAAALVTLVVPGYVERHARSRPYHASDLVAWFQAQPGFASDERPVAMAPTTLAILAGDRLERRVELIPADASCAALAQRRQRGWVVIRDRINRDTLHPFTADRCLAGEEPVYRNPAFRVYPQADEIVSGRARRR